VLLAAIGRAVVGRAGREAFNLTQPTISHHLKVLHEAGLLDREKRGVWVYYRARTQALASLGTLIGTASP
jgi:ArsR family transcriptional regulator